MKIRLLLSAAFFLFTWTPLAGAVIPVAGRFALGIRLRGATDPVITDNEVFGPGVNEELIGTLSFLNAGIQIRDVLWGPDQGNGGLIARNLVRGFDIGIQSTNLDAVVAGNDAQDCTTGLIIGTIGRRVLTTGATVVNNLSTKNRSTGLHVLGAQRNAVLHNDFRFNPDAGVALLEGSRAEPPIPTVDNELIHNTGSVRNMKGNRGGTSRGVMM